MPVQAERYNETETEICMTEPELARSGWPYASESEEPVHGVKPERYNEMPVLREQFLGWPSFPVFDPSEPEERDGTQLNSTFTRSSLFFPSFLLKG